MAKEKEPKQEVYVNSELCYRNTYHIIVTVKGITEGNYSYDYVDKYIFNADKRLTKVRCTKCDDGLFLNVATEHAIEHMKELRKIKKIRFPLFSIFKEEE